MAGRGPQSPQDYAEKKRLQMENAARLRAENNSQQAQQDREARANAMKQKQSRLGLYVPGDNPFARTAAPAAPPPAAAPARPGSATSQTGRQQQAPVQQAPPQRQQAPPAQEKPHPFSRTQPAQAEPPAQPQRGRAAPQAAAPAEPDPALIQRIHELEAEVKRLAAENAELWSRNDALETENGNLIRDMQALKRKAPETPRSRGSRPPIDDDLPPPPPPFDDDERPSPRKAHARQQSGKESVHSFDEQPLKGGQKGMKASPSFDDQPIGGGNKGRNQFDEQPIGGGNKSKANAFDDQPIGGGSKGKNAANGFDDQPIGGGGGKGGRPGPFDDVPPATKPGNAKKAAPPVEEAPIKSKTPAKPPRGSPEPDMDDVPIRTAAAAAKGKAAPANPVEEMPIGGGKKKNAGIPEEAYDDTNDKLYPCPDCGRSFKKAALTKHVNSKICSTTRKPMDMSAQRLGDNQEALDAQAKSKFTEAKEAKAKADRAMKAKRDREQLRQAIEAGRAIAQAKAEGRDIRDIPMPAASSLPDDRVECPHCGRKFGENAAQRHIASCGQRAKRAPPPRR